ncbi:redoxin domain-containing protein [Halobiforma nitratireducens]|uniref:Alkyl hydroperoxide reductase/ Thiol specific antioxidant/ Mal allergen n=1 Tax=Halobiforma nitratireducens JCM 10879 TaxID=1227454 RepID=M0LN33_9EURY|nr:redoxin domain-containing protein [Halobiforma nitratireducens]EMA34916.1 alkyl hydroperoxide reductase/ Thiol specific antioxidant/ Mal allergen [Halobiforma nitratireducens JCM 10879]
MPDFEVVTLEPAEHVEPGEEAPTFTRPLVTDEFWEDRSLSALVGRDESEGERESEGESQNRTILVFTPMTGSFLATYLWDELAERGWDEADATVVGITTGNPYSVKRFIDDNGYPFALFADPATDVAEAYGFVHDLDGMAGVTEPRPAFVAIDADRTVEAVWVAQEWPEFPDYDDLEVTLGIDLDPDPDPDPDPDLE